jgi:N,N'-diacetyllegionaminate synthase
MIGGMNTSIKIGNRRVGDDHPVFVMAEAGANHNGDLALAKELVVAAREAGADCIKFQTFTAAEFCADKTKTFTYKSQGKDVTESEFEMFQRLEFTRDEWAELMAFCGEQDIMFLTTVQDPANLQMMQELGLLGIKVGSDDFDHLVNLRRYAGTGLPLIVSKGMADLAEVDLVLKDIAPRTAGGMAVLHCVSLYPSEARHLNLRQLITLRQRYPNVVWGFSDHSPSTIAPALAVALGARIIEKHFTLDHDLPGPDHWFSMDPRELKEMVEHIRFAEQALGTGAVQPSEGESASRKIMRRRILAKSDLPSGAVLTEGNVSFKRAEQGMYAGDWSAIAGKRLRVAKQALEPIQTSEVET